MRNITLLSLATLNEYKHQLLVVTLKKDLNYFNYLKGVYKPHKA